jgi:hypothetical protein
MPFVEVIWKPDCLNELQLVKLCKALPDIVGSALTLHDPAHLVTAAMVDVRVSTPGPYDRINPHLYVTVLARSEPDREIHKLSIVSEIGCGVHRIGSPPDTLVELVLTNRVSLYNYGDGQ